MTGNVQTVCPRDSVTLNCSVRETRFLVWSVDSAQITCLGIANAGDGCLNGGNGAHAIITTVSRDSRNLANITSLLVLHDIRGHVEVSCEDQITRAQNVLRFSSTWIEAFCGWLCELFRSTFQSSKALLVNTLYMFLYPYVLLP